MLDCVCVCGDGCARHRYFSWSLSASSIVTGSGVLNGFEQYDADQSGTLSESEFCKCAEDLGYGEMAKELWHSMPRVEGNRLNYSRVIASHLDMLGGKDQQVLGLTDRDQCVMLRLARQPPMRHAAACSPAV